MKTKCATFARPIFVKNAACAHLPTWIQKCTKLAFSSQDKRKMFGNGAHRPITRQTLALKRRWCHANPTKHQTRLENNVYSNLNKRTWERAEYMTPTGPLYISAYVHRCVLWNGVESVAGPLMGFPLGLTLPSPPFTGVHLKRLISVSAILFCVWRGLAWLDLI